MKWEILIESRCFEIEELEEGRINEAVSYV
jgi:hypothetical protein